MIVLWLVILKSLGRKQCGSKLMPPICARDRILGQWFLEKLCSQAKAVGKRGKQARAGEGAAQRCELSCGPALAISLDILGHERHLRAVRPGSNRSCLLCSQSGHWLRAVPNGRQNLPGISSPVDFLHRGQSREVGQLQTLGRHAHSGWDWSLLEYGLPFPSPNFCSRRPEMGPDGLHADEPPLLVTGATPTPRETLLCASPCFFFFFLNFLISLMVYNF